MWDKRKKKSTTIIELLNINYSRYTSYLFHIFINKMAQKVELT